MVRTRQLEWMYRQCRVVVMGRGEEEAKTTREEDMGGAMARVVKVVRVVRGGGRVCRNGCGYRYRYRQSTIPGCMYLSPEKLH
jgi:hypothetical protein